MYCCEQRKGKPDYHKTWKDKNNEKSYQRKKGFKPSNLKNQEKQPSEAEKKPSKVMGEKPKDP